MVVERLVARVWLEDPGDELPRIRHQLNEGDDSWARWLDELESGAAAVAAMRMTAYVRLLDGRSTSVDAENHHVWLEVDSHPPLLEAQIQEVAGKDCKALAVQLQGLGGDISADELADMYVHVELDAGLLATLRGRHGDRSTGRPSTRLGVGTETGEDAAR